MLLPGQPGLGGAGGPGPEEPGAVLTDGRAAPAAPQREEALPPAPDSSVRCSWDSDRISYKPKEHDCNSRMSISVQRLMI